MHLLTAKPSTVLNIPCFSSTLIFNRRNNVKFCSGDKVHRFLWSYPYKFQRTPSLWTHFISDSLVSPRKPDRYVTLWPITLFEWKVSPSSSERADAGSLKTNWPLLIKEKIIDQIALGLNIWGPLFSTVIAAFKYYSDSQVFWSAFGDFSLSKKASKYVSPMQLLHVILP